MTDTTEQAAPTNVVAALARIMGEIGGIEKLNPAQRAQRGMSTGSDGGAGISYPYRGIDQITGAAVPLLSKYGVVIVPVVLEHLTRDGLGRNGNQMEHLIRVQWHIYGPGGVDDAIAAETIGESRDTGDKGANKAQTAAFKNLLLRILCITDPSDDTDNYHTADDGSPPRARVVTGVPPADVSEVAEAFKTLKAPQKAMIMRYAGEALGVREFNQPGDMAGEIMAAIRNVQAGREPYEGPAVAPAEPDSDAVADIPPTATASEQEEEEPEF